MNAFDQTAPLAQSDQGIRCALEIRGKCDNRMYALDLLDIKVKRQDLSILFRVCWLKIQFVRTFVVYAGYAEIDVIESCSFTFIVAFIEH